MKKTLFLGLALLLSITQVKANLNAASRIDIWPSIPFIRGADLCSYRDAYGQTRSEYMHQMVGLAKDLMSYGAYGSEALDMLVGFNQLYERNQAYATRGQYLDVTLESTLKSYIDQYYRDLRPLEKKLSFTHVGDIMSVVRSAMAGQRDGSLTSEQLNRLDYIAYGTYALAPNCRGDIQVTLHLIGKDGVSESFIGQGRPEVVMSQIASELFTRFQRTQFPSTTRIGNRQLTLVGGLNGSVDRVHSPRLAEQACETLDARLPNQMELELLDARGDWSGGVSLNNETWAMPNGKIYAPYLRNPTPVRDPWQVNAKVFLYYCVR